MMNRRTKRQDFGEQVAPHLEILLQFSFWLTHNGRDAVRLMREAMTEAHQLWDGQMSDRTLKLWLHKILIRRFYNGFQSYSRPLAPIKVDNIDDSLLKDNRLFLSGVTDAHDQTFLTGEPDDNVNYFEAIAGLPKVFRSAMILSYLEGFSSRAIANLAGAQPHTVESLLNRGRRLIRNELFAHLVVYNGPDSYVQQAEATA